MPVSFNQFTPANVRDAWKTGNNLNGGCTTSLYTGGNPTNANQLKRSIVDASGNIKQGLTNAADNDLADSVKPAV